MLRVFGWVVRFFEWLRVLDDQLEATWLNKHWTEFLKWWLGGSLAIALFALLLVCVPGAVLLELNRLYHMLRGASALPAGLMYFGLGTFAVGFAAVTLTIAFVTCPLFMLQVRQRGK
jgi:hypothetical protein